MAFNRISPSHGGVLPVDSRVLRARYACQVVVLYFSGLYSYLIYRAPLALLAFRALRGLRGVYS